MVETENSFIFAPAISEKEWLQVPPEVAKKVINFVEEKFEELLTSKALSETNCFNAEQKLSELENRYSEIEHEKDELFVKLETAQQTITELETQISTCVNEITKLQTKCNQFESETTQFRHQRDLAVSENEQLTKLLERQNGEIERLKLDLDTLTNQLEKAIKVKCEAQADADEVGSMKLSLEYKEKRLDQEKSLLNSQIESLNEELKKKTETLLAIRSDNSSRCIMLETKLSSKTQELNAANESLQTLTEINHNLTEKVEELTERLGQDKKTHTSALESYMQELEAQMKLADLYKNVSEESKKHGEELTKAIVELQTLLKNATEQYGDLETKHKEMQLTHEEVLVKKNECIDVLKKELESANELLKLAKDETLQRDIEDLAPSAAAASRALKSGMSMTQLYTQYVNVSDELLVQKEEVRRLTSYIEQIVAEIEDKGPYLKKQKEDYDKALETIADMTKHNDQLIMDNQHLREENADLTRAQGLAERENSRLKKELGDLGRQVCHLVREVEQLRGGSSSTSTDQDMSDSASSADIITKRLVTFNDITELQYNNQRLLALVRELSSKQEEAESLDPAIVAKMKMKIESLQEAQADLLEQQERQNKMMTMLIGQRDMYKNLYNQAMRGNGEEVPVNLPHQFSSERASPRPHDENDSNATDEKVQELETQVEKLKKSIDTVKEEHETYRKEKTCNEKLLLDQIEKQRQEITELTRTNCKLASMSDVNDERFKIIKSNVDVYKNQISQLEKQNKIYNETIIKHEEAINYLREQTMNAQTKLSSAEVMLSNLQKENVLLRDAEERLSKEREALKRDAYSQNLLQSNIELIKATLERNDAESRIRLEERVDEAHRECAALRRRLSEEQDRFRELTKHLEKQTQDAQKRLEEEKQQADKLRKELVETREDLIAKSVQIEELTKKLKTSLVSSLSEPSGGSVDSRKVRELEKMLSDSQAEIDTVRQQLKIAKEAVEQHCNVAEGAERQLKEFMEQAETYKKETETITNQQLEKIKELEEKCSLLQGELSIQSDGKDETALDLRGKLARSEESLRIANEDLSEFKQKLQVAQEEIRNLTASLEQAENKYAREMMLHSEDLQLLTNLKDELSRTTAEVNELKRARDEAREILKENEKSWETRESMITKEKEELDTRFKDMEEQNALLLDQIQALNTQLSLFQAQLTDNLNQSEAGDSSFNRSFTENDVKSSEQLLKIIKYLRQEKDIAVSKCDILEAERCRYKSELEALNKTFEETRAAFDAQQEKSEVAVVTVAKHEAVLRKIETLSAITDSNRSLRAERDQLLAEINELKKRCANLEEQMAPLQEKNRELALKAEAMQTENVTLRGEATRWRQRANMLIEKSNRISPEDWKKLQNERENLSKQLTIERGTIARINDELNTLKQEKAKLDEQCRNHRAQNTQLNEELEKTLSELKQIKEQVGQLNREIDQMKENYTKQSEDNRLLTEDITAKEVTISDLKNNLAAVKKIAKKYKQQCEEQLKDIEALKQQNETATSENASNLAEREERTRNEFQERISRLEQNHTERLNEVNQKLATSIEENENNKREIENLKQTALDKEERFKNLFKNAKDRIMSLTEQNSTLKAELNSQGRPKTSTASATDGSSGSQQLSTSGGEVADAAKITELEAEIERLEREKNEATKEKQQEKEKMQSEIDSLVQKVNQLQRQLGQQGSKPSTSSGSSEKSTTEPPTANIKPMAGHSTNTQTQSVPIQPWRSGTETPLASIRPMSMQLRTVAVLPTSQGPSTSQGPVIVPPQQQVHTTGPSNVEAMSSSPTSSHTEYMPATSSAAVVGPRQVAVPPTQSSQDAEDEDGSIQVQPTPQQQAVALVLPRIEPPSNTLTQESGTSSSSSNTVTTTQASLKRPREVDTETSCQTEDQAKPQQQLKRSRLQAGTENFQSQQSQVSDSGVEVEYQVPTSSQRDHEEDNDAVIVVESDEEGEGPDEGEGEDDPDDPDTEGFMDTEQELNFEDADCQEMEEEEERENEVEVIDDSSEVPNQSEHSMQDGGSPQEESSEQVQSEATSSGADGGTSGIILSQASPSVSVTMSTISRTRPVAPLSRQQQQAHLLLPHGLEEGGDDGIVPSTPTLFVPRRSDGFGEAVSSPHVPTSGRFTFNESVPPSNSSSTEVIPEQTLEFSNTDDNGTGRSVPSTPLQSSPQEAAPAVELPTITVSGISDEAEATAQEGSSGECMGPPPTAGTSRGEGVQSVEESEEMMDGEDGVSSEGEKPPTSEEGEDEGREAEASPSTNTRSRGTIPRGQGVARRSVRQGLVRGGVPRSGPTPIIWSEQQRITTRNQDHSGHQMQQHQRNSGRGGNQSQYSPRVARRSRGRAPRPYNRF